MPSMFQRPQTSGGHPVAGPYTGLKPLMAGRDPRRPLPGAFPGQMGIPVQPRYGTMAGLGAMPSITVAPWVRYGLLAGFLALAASRKIPWVVGGIGAAGVWFLLTSPAPAGAVAGLGDTMNVGPTGQGAQSFTPRTTALFRNI